MYAQFFGSFLLSKNDLKAAASEEDRLILELADLPDGYNFDQAFTSLFAWCQRAFVRIGRLGYTCYETSIVLKSARRKGAAAEGK